MYVVMVVGVDAMHTRRDAKSNILVSDLGSSHAITLFRFLRSQEHQTLQAIRKTQLPSAQDKDFTPEPRSRNFSAAKMNLRLLPRKGAEHAEKTAFPLHYAESYGFPLYHDRPRGRAELHN